MKRVIAALSAAALVLTMAGTALAAGAAPSDWAAEEVQAAVDRGMVPEALQQDYAAPITRAQFCDLAVKAAEAEYGPITGYGGVSFGDTDNQNVLKMAWLGVVRGVGGQRFAPDDLLTREQAATMLARFHQKLAEPLEKQEPDFADRDAISGWAREAVGQMERSGIMKGVGGNRFDPQGSYTVEESILTLLRLLELLNKNI